MPSEREKTLAGDLCDARDVEFVAARERACDLRRRRRDRAARRADRSRSVIGAGSVVTRDVPEGVSATGNPCRIVREITG